MNPQTAGLHIACIAEIPLGREMAHAINAFKTAGGFTRLGHRATLFCLPPANGDIQTALDVYGERGLDVHIIEPDEGLTEGQASQGFSRRAVDTAVQLGCDCIYGRNFHVGIFGPQRGLPTAVETHAHVGDYRPLLDQVFQATRDAHRPLQAIVTIAPALRDHYIARGADPARVYLVPDAADPDLFVLPMGWKPAPRKADRPQALYSGHLYEYKGIPTILDAARQAPDIDWILLGGTLADIERTRSQAAGLSNVRVAGRVPHSRVAEHLWNADVLLLPPSAHHPSAGWTSPLKLAEYLWAGRPIAASRIVGLTNWVDEPAVSWFTPDDHHDLVRCTRRLLAETTEQQQTREAAQLRLAECFTYERRCRQIIATLM
ncbi:MAG: glycosyltransferase family 4 protein [Phycisphaerales bacterium]|nr:glycosyltransferase family 4 protein [Phycisphaerales bacterium]